MIASYAQAMADDPRVAGNIEDQKALLKVLLPLKSKFKLDFLDVINDRGMETLHIYREDTLPSSKEKDVEEEEQRLVRLGMTGMNLYSVMVKPSALLLAGVAPTKTTRGINGVVLVGTELDQGFLNSLKERVGADIGLFGKEGEPLAATFRMEPGSCTQCHSWKGREESPAQKTFKKSILAEGQAFIGPSTAGYKYGYLPLNVQGAKITMLVLRASTKALDRTKAEVLGAALGTLILFLALTFLLSRYLVLLIAFPIKKLVEATKRVSGGDLDTQIELKTGDEMEELADSFNQMTRALKDSREEIEAWNRELECRVQERTKELVKALERLSSLRDLGRSMGTVVEAEELLKLALQNSASLLGAEAGAVFLVEENGEGLQAQITYGLDGRLAEGTPISEGE